MGNFTAAKQIHDDKVKIITEDLRGRGAVSYEEAIEATDAMVTKISNICLMILLADCLPILFFDPKKGIIGIAHAGWKGTIRFIAQKVVRVFQEKFGSSPKDLVLGIGPAIGPCCYEVGPGVITQVEKGFHRKKGYIENETPEGRGYLNLWEANKEQLLQMGILEENIEIARICTHCNSHLFFSHRSQKGKTGRFGVGIMID